MQEITKDIQFQSWDHYNLSRIRELCKALKRAVGVHTMRVCGIPGTVHKSVSHDESAALGDTMATDISTCCPRIHVRPLKAEVWMRTQTVQ